MCVLIIDDALAIYMLQDQEAHHARAGNSPQVRQFAPLISTCLLDKTQPSLNGDQQLVQLPRLLHPLHEIGTFSGLPSRGRLRRPVPLLQSYLWESSSIPGSCENAHQRIWRGEFEVELRWFSQTIPFFSSVDFYNFTNYGITMCVSGGGAKCRQVV